MPSLLGMITAYTADDQLPKTGIVQELNLDGTVDLIYMGGTILNVPVVSSYTPTSGDVVQVMRRGPASFIVLGGIRFSNTVSGSVASDFVIAYNIDAVPGTITGGGTAGSSGTLTVMPQTAGSYRRLDGWTRNDVRQGAYYSSVQLGYYHGGWFYGSTAFNALAGRTITRVRIYLNREQAGDYSEQPIYLYGHKNATKPTGDIYFLGQKIAAITMQWPESGVYDLPVSVGQNLATGYWKGLGLLYSGTSHYVVLSSIAQYSNSGRLDISWRED